MLCLSTWCDKDQMFMGSFKTQTEDPEDFFLKLFGKNKLIKPVNLFLLKIKSINSVQWYLICYQYQMLVFYKYSLWFVCSLWLIFFCNVLKVIQWVPIDFHSLSFITNMPLFSISGFLNKSHQIWLLLIIPLCFKG